MTHAAHDADEPPPPRVRSAPARPLVIGIDPGETQSAWVLFDGERVLQHRHEPNVAVRSMLRGLVGDGPTARELAVVIERLEGFGKIASRAEYRTAEWAGIFYEAASAAIASGRVEWLTRRAIKLHLTGVANSKDAQIRDVLMERFPGLRAQTGPARKLKTGGLLKSHEWAALAVAVTWLDRDGRDDRR